MVRSIHSWSRPVGVHTLFYYLTFKNWSSLFDYYVLQFVKNLNGNHNFTHFSIYSIQCLIFSLVAKIRDQNEIKFVQDGCCILSGLFSCVDWTRFFFVVEKLINIKKCDEEFDTGMLCILDQFQIFTYAYFEQVRLLYTTYDWKYGTHRKHVCESTDRAIGSAYVIVLFLRGKQISSYVILFKNQS